jgi:hypothetical protein
MLNMHIPEMSQNKKNTVNDLFKKMQLRHNGFGLPPDNKLLQEFSIL